jgi:hypothetical protein
LGRLAKLEGLEEAILLKKDYVSREVSRSRSSKKEEDRQLCRKLVFLYIQPFHLYPVFALLGNTTSENAGKLRASDPNGSPVPIDRSIMSDLLSYMEQAVLVEKLLCQPVRILAKEET